MSLHSWFDHILSEVAISCACYAACKSPVWILIFLRWAITGTCSLFSAVVCYAVAERTFRQTQVAAAILWYMATGKHCGGWCSISMTTCWDISREFSLLSPIKVAQMHLVVRKADGRDKECFLSGWKALLLNRLGTSNLRWILSFQRDEMAARLEGHPLIKCSKQTNIRILLTSIFVLLITRKWKLSRTSAGSCPCKL